MFFRMLKGALFRQKSKMIMIAITIALGASLATAMAMPNNDWKPLAVASASAAVAATSRAYVTELEWRRWVTLPRSYSVAHVQLPPPGTPRRMTLTVNLDGGGTRDFELEFSPEANRAAVYLRDVGNGKFVLKKWESME